MAELTQMTKISKIAKITKFSVSDYCCGDAGKLKIKVGQFLKTDPIVLQQVQ